MDYETYREILGLRHFLTQPTSADRQVEERLQMEIRDSTSGAIHRPKVYYEPPFDRRQKVRHAPLRSCDIILTTCRLSLPQWLRPVYPLPLLEQNRPDSKHFHASHKRCYPKDNRQLRREIGWQVGPQKLKALLNL